MAEPFSFKMPLNEWRHYLQDINFWLKGFLKSPAYRDLEEKLDRYGFVQWNVGVGPAACFTRAISSIIREVKIKEEGPFDHVIEVDMKQALVLGTRLSINDKLAIKVAEQLGLLNQEYDMLKAEGDELWYYTYGYQDATDSLQKNVKSTVYQIVKKLLEKKYLLVINNLNEPIKPINLSAFTEDLSCLPPPQWEGSFWIVSGTSKDVYDRSKPDYNCIVDSFSGDDILMLTLYSLHQTAKYILGVTGHKDEQYWHHVAVRCFHYILMLLIPHCSYAHRDGDQQSSDALADITSDEQLIRQWAIQGLITGVLERTTEVTAADCQGKYNNIYQVGNVILEAFREYSLLQLLFSPATKVDEATKSAAHFLACYNLVAECHTTEEVFFCEGNHPGLERMRWISHLGDQGWHVSREWLRQGASGPTTLIIRHCPQQSRLFMKLQSNHFLAKLSCLHVLDLSYTPLESLPPSICCLQKLQLLSLRGCYNLRSPFSFPDTEITLRENNNNKKLSSLYYFDLSYSNISNFQGDFFRNMPNLKELLLVKCSNLEEMPPSIVALSSLTTLELTRTQIKSFPREMFEEMKKLQSLKLTENKKLLLVPGLVSKLCGLINIHIEGCEPMTEVEVTLERHPTLRSFTFIGAPHMRRLSLRGCTMLEHVDIKEVDALEELDLSATAIRELPEDIPNLPQLRRLLLMGVPFLRRFPWHKLQRLPGVFCLDQCSDKTGNHSNPQDAQVCVSDSRFFYSFDSSTRDLVRGGSLLKSFYVRVTSCKATTREIHDEEDMVKTDRLQVALTAYADVNHHYLTDGVVFMVSMDDVPPFREAERHVEISAVDRYPRGLYYLLQVTKSISMSDDTHISCLSDLGYLDSELEECKLQRCHQMQEVFSDYVRPLRHAFVSHLKSLTRFYSGGYDGFDTLKHLHLEYCPRLEVISSPSALPSLVTLDIRFCYNLKAIFYGNNYHPRNYYQLPRLRRIRLQELPLLEHPQVDEAILTAPAWEELHVRGCWSLRRLPRLDQQPDKAVKVSGERAWWTKLWWDDVPSHRGSYEARLPPASASIRERVVIRTYLR
ncbi:hypothetical protein SETIT_7G083300v2 [Setaria italica]|uniref:Disease resistance protein At4g27190-like leucine-rich repeats domain-containing protein n=2 Tax=Setaria italica TaxID=4555 RepID=A0A368RTH6_SETIT|nr:uncharacterized protein LOC101768457 isoform X1 [Setaria italica]XP_004975490.1 uncharacterized protein LOC101768457 isoform X1 [Setaria italica]XP_022684526.1 uncharacterized protein LOC101768457 isoform X1 [Setaria italica]RCV33435.1 hypothetical protein SETIT_7G083300v2 [Setaria italica]